MCLKNGNLCEEVTNLDVVLELMDLICDESEVRTQAGYLKDTYQNGRLS